jgi:8-amino-3,8-dideoxy-alpha-D-manno-octulosonate transaminase
MVDGNAGLQAAGQNSPPSVSAPLPLMYPGGMRIGEEEEAAVREVIQSRRLFRYYGVTEGPSKVLELEQAFARFTGSSYAAAVTSGTAALICGLQALGIGPGDEVIVPAYTWIATASAVVAVGAVPVIAEVDTALTLDAGDVEQKITPYTRAIIPVHMRGAPCNMDRLMAVARKHQLSVLEDTAQANGASFHGKRLGTFGDLSAFSLQFNKIITSGEGGMVITDDVMLYERVQMAQDVVGGIRNHIPDDKILPGVNFRMPELLGAVALVQLRRLEGLLQEMRARKQVIKQGLADVAHRKGIEFRAQHDPDGDAGIALIFFAPEPADARRIAARLNAEGVDTSVLFSPDEVDYHTYYHWSPIMNQRTWSEKGGPWRNHPRPVTYNPDACPRSLALLSRSVHIDISPELTNSQVEEVIEALTKSIEAVL